VARSLDCVKGSAEKAWNKLVEESTAALRKKQEILETDSS